MAPTEAPHRRRRLFAEWLVFGLFQWGLGAHVDGGPYGAQFAASALALLHFQRRRQLAEATVLAARNQLEATLDAIPDLLFELGLDGRYYEVHTTTAELLAASAAALIGKTVPEMLPPDAADVVMSALREAHAAGRSHGRQFLLPLPQGNSWFELSVARKPVAPGEAPRFIVLSRDITERKRAEADLRVAAVAFESQEGMVITDADSVILRVNKAFVDTTGYTADEAVGQTPRLLRSGRHSSEFYRAMWESIHRTGCWQGEIWDRRKNGEEYPKWLTISAVKGEDGVVTHYVGTHIDITERKVAEGRLHNLAFYDPLTRLPNRRLLLDRLGQALAASVRSQRHGAIMFIDLDKFKVLNDTQGHDVGDQLLVEAARRLQLSVRQGDTVARLGGDEFVVMLENLEAGEMAAVQADGVAQKVLDALDRHYRLEIAADSGGHHAIDHHCSASIGITLFGAGLESIDDLLKRADLAMYRAKEAGRNTVRFFDLEMQTSVSARVALEDDLRAAIDEGQILLHYQPQMVGEGRLTGAEALARWRHPRRGMVPPLEFIPLAEQSGLILALGQRVLEAACAQLARWADGPETARLTLAVNVSAHEFLQADFVDRVLDVVGRSGANPQRLTLELTESLLAANVEEVIGKMGALKAKGVGFALDDFGKGYSSLSYLKRLPLDQLKIDRGFVADILIEANDAAVAKMTIALGESLGLTVIAEGVESEAQRIFLARQGCHAYQGYLFSRPLPPAEFEAFARHGGFGDSTRPA